MIAMKGKDCVAIASDLRYGIRLHTHGTNFPVSAGKSYLGRPSVVVPTAGNFKPNSWVYWAYLFMGVFTQNVKFWNTYVCYLVSCHLVCSPAPCIVLALSYPTHILLFVCYPMYYPLSVIAHIIIFLSSHRCYVSYVLPP